MTVQNETQIKALLQTIRSKREELASYIAKREPRLLLLTNLSIIFSAIAAALTAGPGVGGREFIKSISGMISFGVPIWQLFCVIASLLSVSVVIFNGMLKSHDAASKLASARNCDAKLEGLETMLKVSQIELKQAASLYAQYLKEIPHI